MATEQAAAVAEPKGLHMSLDALIREKTPGARKDGPRQQGMDHGQRRDVFPHRGRGRGGRGEDRGRFNGFGPQQGWQQVPGSFPEAQRLVRVDTGAGQGFPGPVLLLPPEFLAQQAQQGGPLGWPMGFPPGGMPPPHMLGLHAGGFGGMGDRFAHPPPPSREKCSVDEETGDVAVRLGRTEIVKVSLSGDVTLDSGGDQGLEVFGALNNALKPLGIRITKAGPEQWSVSDGRSLTRFQDGMTLPSKGATSATRRAVLLAHYKAPGVSAAAAAATAASNAAAAAAGLLPAADAGAGGFYNGAGPGPGFGGATNGFGHAHHYENGGFRGGPDRTQRFVASGGGRGSQHQRRLKAQGRYTPY